jgi:hypothetical protein
LENTLLASRQKSDEARGQDRAAAAAGALTSVDRAVGLLVFFSEWNS